MKPQPSRLLLGGLSVLLLLAWLLPIPVALANGGVTFAVGVTADGVDVNPGDGTCATDLGECTLRAAVMEANALPSADRIELGPNFYSLSIPGSDEEGAATGDLDIYGTLTIAGQGMMGTYIDAGGAAMGDRALHVHQGAMFTLEGVSVMNADIGAGANGAGLRNDDGTVVIRSSSFQFNEAHNGAGLMNVGTMRIEHSLIGFNKATDAGAGIRNDGTLEIVSSAIIENEALASTGAGIENHGTLTIRNSTISSNRAGSGGAAIYNGFGANGGGASLTLNNVTVYVNMVLTGGGGEGVTGGIYNESASSVELSNSIVARNAINGVAAVDCLGTITSRGYNLFSNLGGCAVGGDPSHDIVRADPGLDWPSDLDPAGTISYSLETGSPALAAGNPAVPGSSAFACEPVDQRDVTRPQGSRCDIGAREMPADMEPPTDTPGPEPSPTDTPTDTPGSSPTATGTQTDTLTPTTDLPLTPTATETSSPTSSPTTIPAPRVWSATGPLPRSYFGYSVAGGGDVNGDGFSDLLIGARDYRSFEVSEGAAFLFYGGPDGPASTPGWQVESNMAFATMGQSVDVVGDVNGDGFDDVLVGAPQYSQGQTSEGVVFAYYGSPAGPPVQSDWSAEGDQNGASFGWSVRGAGDVNADGYDDVIIGARYYSGEQDQEGKADVYLGSPSGLQATPAWQHEINIANAGFGYSVSGAGDVNGDGFDDILVGSYNYISGTLNGGNAYLFLGSASGIGDTPAWIGSSGASLDGYGHAVAGAGDVNADGFDDILVTATGEYGLVEGKAYLYYGSAAGPSTTATWIGSDGTNTTMFGFSAAGSCDVNNDGYDDFVVGDPNDRGGRVHFYLGGPGGMPTSSSWWVDPPGSGAAGHSTGRAGNVDRDGYCDVIVGNPINGNGSAHLYFGYPAVPGTPATPIPTPLPSHTPEPTATSTPTASPTPFPGGLFFDGFETGDLSAWSAAQTDAADLSASPEAAIGGAVGLRAVIDDNRALYVADTTPAGERTYAARFYFDPNGIVMASGNAFVIFKAMDAASRTAFQVELRSFQGDFQVRAYAPWDSGGGYATPWIRIWDDPHLIEVFWQAASADGAGDGSLSLSLDDHAVAWGDGIDNDTRRVDSVRLGAVAGLDTATRGTTYFDAFGSAAGGTIGPDPAITLPPPPVLPDVIFADGFESGGLSAWSAVKNETDLIVNSSAAIVGGSGLEAVMNSTAPRYVSDWTPVSQKAYAARFYFDPNSISMASGNSHVLFKAVDATARTAFQLELRSYQGDYQIRAYAPWDSGGAYVSPWFRLSDDPHLLELIWQAASGDGAGDGWLNLLVDEESVASGSGLDNDTRRVDKVDLGAVAGLDRGTSGTYYFDAFASTTGIPIGPDPGANLPTPPTPPDEIFADGFESRGLSGWSVRTNEGDLFVNNGSALVGGYGLEAIVDDTAPRYLTDWSPVGEKEYHVRFAFDPNSLTMLDGRAHVIFQALSGSSKIIACVELRYKSLNYELRSGLLTDAGRWVNTGWWYIDDAPQVIELEWRAASDAAAADGWLVMWINEVQSETRESIANGNQSVDLVRLGLIAGVDTGTLGSMSFDAFESRRTSHIGLPGE